MKWQITKLQDLALNEKGSIVSGPFESNIGSRFFVDEGIPVIRGNNLTKGEKKFIDEGFVYLTEIKAAEFKNCNAIKEDIIFTAAGSIGQVGIIPDNTRFKRYIISNKQLRVRIDKNKAIPLFVYYWLTTPRMIDYIESMNNGGAVPLLNLGIIRKILVPLPPLGIQTKICEIISNYNDQIENNIQKIQFLEEAARIIFREWFVYFRFSGHEKLKMVDGIPEGWSKIKFSELVDFKEGPGLRNYQFRNDGIPFLNIRTFEDDEIDFNKVGYLDEIEVYEKYKHFLLEEDDHVISSSGTLGRLVSIRKSHLPLMLNTSLIRMRPKKQMRKWTLKAYLLYSDFIDMVSSLAIGAAQSNFGPAHLRKITILFPKNVEIINEFENIISPIYIMKKNLLDQNRNLIKARDLLLPKLMSGAIEV